MVRVALAAVDMSGEAVVKGQVSPTPVSRGAIFWHSGARAEIRLPRAEIKGHSKSRSFRTVFQLHGR
jgi:hypothetical protein